MFAVVLGSAGVADAFSGAELSDLWHLVLRDDNAHSHVVSRSVTRSITRTASKTTGSTAEPRTTGDPTTVPPAVSGKSPVVAPSAAPAVATAPTTRPTEDPKCDRWVASGQSISNAVGSANAGDVVCVHGGVYAEKVEINRSNITVTSAPGESAIVDGTGLGLAAHDALWSIGAGVDNVTVSGFIIRDSSGRGLVNDGSHNRVDGNHITNTYNAGLLTTNWGGAATGNEYSFNEIDHTVLANDCFVVSDPCSETSGWESAIGQYNAGSAPAGGNLYTDNNVHDNGGEGATTMDGDVFVDNTMHDNFGVEIYLDETQRATVESNFLYESERSYLPIGVDGNESYRLLARGIGLADEQVARSAGNMIRGNLIVNTRDGIQFWNTGRPGTGLIDDTIENNTIINTWDYGLAFDPGADARTVVRDNIVVPRRGAPTRGLPAPGIVLDGNTFTTRGGSNDPRLPGEGTFSLDPADYGVRRQ